MKHPHALLAAALLAAVSTSAFAAPSSTDSVNNRDAKPAEAGGTTNVTTAGDMKTPAASSNTASTTATMSSGAPTRQAAENFVSNVNSARVALALKDTGTARQQVDSAITQLNSLKTATAEQRRFTAVPSGRLSFGKDEEGYYYPIETGPVEVKTVKDGPFWARQNRGIAVTDAEIVYLTLDLNNDKAINDLTEARAQIDKGDFAAAQKRLASVAKETVKVDSTVDVPLDKARDNIMLSRQFIRAGNYDGARFALKHADSALDKMERDQQYAPRHAAIQTMRKDYNGLQASVKANDPNAWDKADTKLSAWWNDLKSWTADKTDGKLGETAPAR